jgi:two-component system NtrC family response regulator
MAHENPGNTPQTAVRQSASRVDVIEKNGRLYVNVELPGLTADEVDVRISDGLLNICSEREADEACSRQQDLLPRDRIVGQSQPIKACLRALLAAAATDSSLLLYGETGTGKELFARALHEHSGRSAGKFVVVDCTARPEIQLSTLFLDHDKGEFTGADKTCEGLLSQAHHGTLFLDEVADLSPPLQKAFLRVLEEQRFRPLGNNAGVESDIRLVAATNRDLPRCVALGQFSDDLLDRLQACVIKLPPLRSRIEDIRLLAPYHIEHLCRKHGCGSKQLTPEFLEILCRYEWPGNVRELINTLEQALLTAGLENTLFPKHLPQHVRIQVARAALRSRLSGPVLIDGGLPRLHDYRSGVFRLAERKYLANLVQHSGHNVDRACRLAGLSRSRFYSLLKKHQISFN